jgi:long-chain acyl-CoA synthetase
MSKPHHPLGLQRVDRLASLISNRVELIVHDLAGLRSGLVLTPLNDRYVPLSRPDPRPQRPTG